MELTGLLESLKKDIAYFNDPIKEVSGEILDNKLSEFPVFVAHQNNINLGEMILNRDDFGRKWSVSVTTLEELVSARIIDSGRVKDFKEVYKDPFKHICVLMVGEFGANFVFIPFHQKKKKGTK